MRSTIRLYRSVLVASALFSSLAFAQGSAVVTGIVTDAATSKPVPDVVITATSSALQGEEVVVTDSSGLYRLAQLPAGVYTLKLEKESFKPYSRTDINVRTDRTVRVNIQLQPEAVQGDTVVVVGRPPTVDIGSTTTGINVGKDFINNIAFIQPNGSGVRSFESLASVAPQVVADEYGFGFSGAQSPENLYLVDGVSTGDPAFGTNGAQFPIEFVEEANVITGGYMAEYGRATGGVLNVVTKSGSNEFHGMVWGNWTPGVLTGNRKEVDSAASAIVTNSDPNGRGNLLNTVDFGAQVGGPILKDRLWFFVGFAPSFSWTKSTRSLRAFVTDPVTGEETNPVIPGSTQTREERDRAFSYIAKLTFLINADNNLSLSVVGSPSTAELPRSFAERRSTANGWTGGSDTIADTNTLSLRYQGGFLDKHLLLDASVGWFRLRSATLPNDGSAFTNAPGTASGTPAVIMRRTRPITDYETLTAEGQALCNDPNTSCPGSVNGGDTYTIGGFGFLQDATLDRLQGRASATYLFQGLGHHIVKAGLDIEHLRYDLKKAYSGEVVLREVGSGVRFDDYRQYGYFTGPDTAQRQFLINSVPTSNSVGAYLQDSWSIMDLVTLNLGLRYENQQLFAGDNTLGLTLNNMLSPRVGVIYDFTQQGRSKLFANFSRYYEAMPIDIADRALTGENQYQFQHAVKDHPTAQPGNPGCDPLASIDQALNECQDPLNTRRVNAINGGDYDPSASGLQTGAGKTPVDPNLKPQSSDEIVVGGEYEIISDGRVGVTYTRRYMNAVIEDMSVDEASSYFIGNPGEGISSQFPKAVRDYDAVTGYFNKAFSDGWMGQVSYTYSSLRGNYNGLFRPETGQLDPNINADFDLISLLPNRTGPLDADRNHFIKAYASKEFQITSSFSVVAGLTYEGRSGAPINYLGSHALYGPDEAFVLPRGSGGRLPWRHAINAKAGVRYKISKDNVVEFTADVFNMFNFQAVTAVDQTITSAEALPFQTSAADPQAAACLAGTNLPQCSTPTPPDEDGDPVLNADGTQAYNLPIMSGSVPLSSADLNPNFKRPTAYQAPISVRFGIRFSF